MPKKKEEPEVTAAVETTESTAEVMKHATSNLRPMPKRSLPTDFVHTAA